MGVGAENVRLRASATGLPKDSVANVSQIVTVDRALLTERSGKLTWQCGGICGECTVPRIVNANDLRLRIRRDAAELRG